MAAGAGKDFLLKVESAPGSGTYNTIAGLRSSSFSGSAEEIDVTTIDEDQWKTLLAGAGIRSVGLSGSGILKDGATITQIEESFLAQTLLNYQLVTQRATWTGAFKITAYEDTGEYNGAQQFSLTLVSSGQVTRA